GLDSEEDGEETSYLSAGRDAYERTAELLREVTEGVDSQYGTPYGNGHFNGQSYSDDQYSTRLPEVVGGSLFPDPPQVQGFPFNPSDAGALFTGGLHGGGNVVQLGSVWGPSGGSPDAGGISAGADKKAHPDAERRPEERAFCTALKTFNGTVAGYQPGELAWKSCRLSFPILNELYEASSSAHKVASVAAERSLELHGGAGGNRRILSSAMDDEVKLAAEELQLEKNTWKLLHQLTQAREEDEQIKVAIGRDNAATMAATWASNGENRDGVMSLDAAPGPDAPDGEVLRRLRLRDAPYRRTEAIVKWLEDTATETLSGAPGLGLLHNPSMWGRTLECIRDG
ncbi:unnamed protein product, partial [Choristocarpus tenellus]